MKSICAALAGIALAAWPAGAQSRQVQDTLNFAAAYERRDAMIPMRDGAKLYTEIYTPRNPAGPLPFLMERTPYDARSGLSGFRPTETGYSTRLHDHTELARAGYIIVLQDIRGRYRSEGQYVTLRAPRKNDKESDESTDTWDTIDWLVKNVPGNNGRVGVLGISYGGFTTMRAMENPHPALKAASPQATCADMFVGDDWFHNGAFRLDYSFRWISGMERARTRNLWVFDKTDSFEWFLALGPLSNINAKYLKGQAPSWNLFVQHPNLDEYWEREMCGVLPFITDLTVPALNVLGWFDAEDFVGPLQVYKKLEGFDKAGGSADRRIGGRNYLVIGPWFHGSWTMEEDGDHIGAIDFGSATSKYFRETIQLPWFEYWLKDKGRLDMPEVRAFQTGSNTWESFDTWPPKGVSERKLYLHAGGKLSFEPPSASGEAFDSYVSDPASPVPYRHRPIRGGIGWPQWQLEDQRLAHLRPDVLTFVSDTLTEDITVSGDVVAKLFASTSGSDSDWIVKLIDVFPEPDPTRPEMGGFQMMVAGEVFRAKFRNNYRVPEAVVPGKVTPYSINLRDRNHRFQRGHRIMVQIQSTWFPLIDRNPQKFVPSIFEARAEDFQVATQRVYRSREAPTHLVLPVR